MFKLIKSSITFMVAVCLVLLLFQGDVLGKEKILRTFVQVDITTLDPNYHFRSQDKFVLNHIFEGMVTLDLTAKPPFPVVLQLAESYDISKDAKTLTFKLRKGVQFHHGYGELTSEDVVFTYQRQLSDPAAYAKNLLVDIERVEAVDKYTVRIHLKSPSAFDLIQVIAYQNASFVQSKKAFEKLGAKGFERMPIGTGPYQFDRWFPGEKVVLKKFDQYWGGTPALDGIEIWIILEAMIALGQIEKGGLDVAYVVNPGSWEAATRIKGTYIATNTSAQLFALYLNNKVKPLDDVRVRRALAHALDLKALCANIGSAANAWPSPFSPPGFAATDEFWSYKYDLDKAKKLLTEAGYPNGFELTMIYMKQDIFEEIALEAKNMWEKIVKVKLERIDRALYSQTVRSYKQHVAVWNYTRYSPSGLSESYLTGTAINYSQYSNPLTDDIARKARIAKSAEEARQYWREFQSKIAEDVPVITAVNLKPVILIKNNVKGVIPIQSDILTLIKASME